MLWENNNVIVTLHSDSTESLYTGDIVTGNITLDLKKDLKVDSINMEIVGISKALWTRFSPTVPYLKIYTEETKVFYVKQDNLFFDNHQINRRMGAGIHCHPFHFALPPNLPSTFKSSIGSVSYYIKIKSKPACKIKKLVPFNVLANVNLNNIDNMLKHFTYDYRRNFRNAAILVNLRTYISFAPKQIVPFEVTIKNERQVIIKKISITLIQKVHYTVSSGYADDERDMYQVDIKKIKNTTVEVCNFFMEIPQTAPSSINTTEPNMIDISYELKMEVFFLYHFNLIESIPVTVAAVPVIHYDF